MRTLFCSHLDGVPLPPVFALPPDASPSRQRTASASLVRKYPGGELPAGQGGAELPDGRRAQARRTPFKGEPA